MRLSQMPRAYYGTSKEGDGGASQSINQGIIRCGLRMRSEKPNPMSTTYANLEMATSAVPGKEPRHSESNRNTTWYGQHRVRGDSVL